ncbi:hypothetical protein GQ600_20906 [Phytophthora cactorum]|nr:hypothetical protein GQ600_20906 [Phytophthora cactorum]
MDQAMSSCKGYPETLPNLLELSLRKGWVAVRLNFSEFHARRQSVPKLRFQWHDICGLAADLSKVHDPFTKCVRRLTVNLTNLEVFGYSNWVRYGPALNSYLDALLQMLPIHHLRVVNRGRKLSMRTKAAFLSATCISSGVRSSSFKSGKAMKGEHSFSSRPTQCYLDRRVISNIFGFATSPVYRQVYFREKINDDTTSGLC